MWCTRVYKICLRLIQLFNYAYVIRDAPIGCANLLFAIFLKFFFYSINYLILVLFSFHFFCFFVASFWFVFIKFLRIQTLNTRIKLMLVFLDSPIRGLWRIFSHLFVWRISVLILLFSFSIIAHCPPRLFMLCFLCEDLAVDLFSGCALWTMLNERCECEIAMEVNVMNGGKGWGKDLVWVVPIIVSLYLMDASKLNSKEKVLDSHRKLRLARGNGSRTTTVTHVESNLVECTNALKVILIVECRGSLKH